MAGFGLFFHAESDIVAEKVHVLPKILPCVIEAIHDFTCPQGRTGSTLKVKTEAVHELMQPLAR
jgi:hypothetical protein